MKEDLAPLKSHKLRTTSSRSAILDLFRRRGYALSYSDIEQEVANHYDRVTVYRTLKTFLDKGMIHKVLDDTGTLKYALCQPECTEEAHHHEHVHFKCIKCGQTTCLDKARIPLVNLPAGYKAQEFNLLIQGVCKKCA